MNKEQQQDITIIKNYNVLRVTLPKGRPEVARELKKTLVATRKMSERVRGKLRIWLQEEPCYVENVDPENNDVFYIIGTGFLDILVELGDKHNLPVYVLDNNEPTPHDVIRMLPDQAELEEMMLRKNQVDIFRSIMANERGQYKAATGMGKSYLMQMVCCVFRSARILITSYSKRVCTQIYNDLKAKGKIDVAMVTGSSRNLTARVQVCTIGMIDRAYDREWDVMLLDEKHECTTINRISALMRVKCRAAYALSANDGDKQDTSELWLNAIFGPVRSNVTYRDVMSQGEVVPVHVKWVRTPVDEYRPGRLRPGSVDMDRYALWRNRDRNAEAVRLALQSVEERGQTMIYVSTIEHALQLRAMVNCPVAIRPQSTEDWNVWVNQGDVPYDMDRPASNSLGELEDDFREGKVKLVIANSVWKRGLNFPQLKTLIRLDGSSTMEDATQITGRVNRTFPGKTDGLVYDFWDVQEPSLLDRSRSRRKAYKDIGYTQDGDIRTTI